MIPGEMNVSGASLYGSPVINIGHTENIAWSHTVSTAFRFTPIQLDAGPDRPDPLHGRRAVARDGDATT